MHSRRLINSRARSYISTQSPGTNLIVFERDSMKFSGSKKHNSNAHRMVRYNETPNIINTVNNHNINSADRICFTRDCGSTTCDNYRCRAVHMVNHSYILSKLSQQQRYQIMDALTSHFSNEHRREIQNDS